MGYLFILIVLSSVLLIIFPIVFKLVFVQLLGFSKAQIKLKHPFKFMGLLLQLGDPIWGIQSITIYIPEINIKLDRKNFKVSIVIDKPRIMLTRNKSQFTPISIVDGVPQNSIFFNLVTILKYVRQTKQKTKDKLKKSKPNIQPNRISLVFKTFAQFCFLITIQFVEVKIGNGELVIVSSLPKGNQKIDALRDIRSGIIMLQCFAQYLLYIDNLTIGASVHSDHEVNISIFCAILKLYTAEHMENNLITGQKLMVKIRIPLSFSVQQSLKRLGVFITIPSLAANSTPVDFQNLSNILNQFIFQSEYFQENSEFKKKSQQRQNESQEQEISKKIVINIDEAIIKMTQICEQDYDTNQALKYLSNISYVLLKFQKIKLNETGFKVNSVNLSLKKYDYTNEINQKCKQKNENKQLLKIDNLLITKEGKITSIYHDDVKLSCQKQELALLGKLFRLINSRVIKDQYEQRLYLPFVQIVKQHIKGKLDIAETLQAIATRKNQFLSLDQKYEGNGNHDSHKQSTLIYSPHQIELELDISELVHKITLSSPQYKQSRTEEGEIKHELTFKRILLDYKGIKQFSISDLRLEYREAQRENQLDLQVTDIQMVQNFNTLKDYLIGFTMFKMLLQFSIDEAQQNNKKVVKAGKKTLNFTKIVLNYANELLTLRKLSIAKQTSVDNKLSSLYFSLGKCDFSVQKLYLTDKRLKYALNTSHNLLSITSVTLKQFLTVGNEPGGTPKQKFMIHIKSPVFLLPEIDISQRLINYFKTFNQLQPSIQAFIRNTTDQKIKAKRRKYKIFMVDTDVFVIKITNLLIGIEDSVFDRSMLNKMRFERQYLSRKPKYNESQTVNFLRQTNQIYNLFQIQIQCISIDIKPLIAAGTNQKTVRQWTIGMRERYKKVDIMQTEGSRLIRANNLHVAVELTKLQTKIRDYPFNIANISKIKGNLQYLKTKNIYEQTQHYLVIQMQIDEIQIEIGLSLLSGLSQIFKKLSKYDKAIDQYKNTDEFLHTIKTKSSLELSKFKPYWHIMHKSMDWHIMIQKESRIKARLLTGLTPYAQESVDLYLGKISFSSNPLLTQFSIQSLQLYGNKLQIFQIGKQTFSLQSFYIQPNINLNIRLEIASFNPTNNNSHLKDSKIIVSQQIIKQLWKIKQLRTDWLLIYGLVEPYSKQQENVLKRQNQINYVDLIKMAANMKLKNKDRQLSIFSVLQQVKLSCNIDKFCLQLADQNNSVDLIIQNFNYSLVVEVKSQKWKMRHFLLQLQNIIGRLKQYKRKQLTHYASNHQFLILFNELIQSQIPKRKNQKELFKQIFLVCRNLKLRLNQYGKVNQQILYILKKLEVNTLKLQLSKELKRIIDALFISIFESNKQKVSTVKTSHYFRKSSVQKFREVVVLVMRANRKRKKVCNRIKIYVKIKSIEVGFKTPKRLLLLTNGKPTILAMNTTFHSKDMYRIDPKMTIKWIFSEVQIWVSMDPNHLWVFGKGYSPNNTLQAERLVKSEQISLDLDKHENQNLPQAYEKIVTTFNIERYTNLHLQFHDGQIQLTHENIQVLKQIGQILITLVDSKEQKKRQWKAEKDKYSEMITHGRQAIQNKLIWKFTDLKKGPAPSLLSQVYISLDQVKIILVSTRNQIKSIQGQKLQQKQQLKLKNKDKKYPFMTLVSSNIEVKVQVFNDDNLNKEFKINNLHIINCLEEQNSNYRFLFQMNHAENLAVQLKIQDCLLSATDSKIGWNFYKSLYIHFNPVKVKFTEDLYDQIYHFFFGIKPDADEKDEELSNILPDYYLSILIDEFKVQAWYKTSSILKRLQGVNVGLEKFELKEVFLHKKGVFDLWVKFLIKQLASQFFNVLGQKLFG